MGKQNSDAALAWPTSLPDEVKGDAMNNIVEQLTAQDFGSGQSCDGI